MYTQAKIMEEVENNGRRIQGAPGWSNREGAGGYMRGSGWLRGREVARSDRERGSRGQRGEQEGEGQ
jgi:hypothetical protein